VALAEQPLRKIYETIFIIAERKLASELFEERGTTRHVRTALLPLCVFETAAPHVARSIEVGLSIMQSQIIYFRERAVHSMLIERWWSAIRGAQKFCSFDVVHC
jgi:hypothetical protein